MQAKHMAGLAAAAGVVGFVTSVEPTVVTGYLSDMAQNQIVHAGFFFTLAAWIHAGRVKAEIRSAFVGLTESLNQLSIALRQELKSHADMLAVHSEKLKKLDTLEQSVADLEKSKAPTQSTGG